MPFGNLDKVIFIYFSSSLIAVPLGDHGDFLTSF